MGRTPIQGVMSGNDPKQTLPTHRIFGLASRTEDAPRRAACQSQRTQKLARAPKRKSNIMRRLGPLIGLVASIGLMPLSAIGADISKSFLCSSKGVMSWCSVTARLTTVKRTSIRSYLTI